MVFAVYKHPRRMLPWPEKRVDIEVVKSQSPNFALIFLYQKNSTRVTTTFDKHHFVSPAEPKLHDSIQFNPSRKP
ncbi:hypothetical protein L1887_29181 [Cichorium endivia]|nr:hypothetical protein L1887_29181 [Cichorium endivia]